MSDNFFLYNRQFQSYKPLKSVTVGPGRVGPVHSIYRLNYCKLIKLVICMNYAKSLSKTIESLKISANSFKVAILVVQAGFFLSTIR